MEAAQQQPQENKPELPKADAVMVLNKLQEAIRDLCVTHTVQHIEIMAALRYLVIAAETEIADDIRRQAFNDRMQRQMLGAMPVEMMAQ